MSQLEQQMRHRDREMVPRVLVQAMFALMLASLALVSVAVLTGRAHTGVPQQGPIAQERAIVFSGNRSGEYTVFDATGAEIAHSSDDRMGFIGVIGRVADRERMLHGIDLATPLSLVRRQDGTLAILDDATGWSVELRGYGADNVAAFARLLP